MQQKQNIIDFLESFGIYREQLDSYLYSTSGKKLDELSAAAVNYLNQNIGTISVEIQDFLSGKVLEFKT